MYPYCACNGSGCDACMPLCDPCLGGLYPYGGGFGCGTACEPTYLTRPFAEAQELVVFPVAPYVASSGTPGNSFLCGPCKPPPKQGNWCTLASTSLCCETSIQDIVYYMNGSIVPTPTSSSEPAFANKIIVWINPCALPGPCCCIKPCLTVRGIPTATEIQSATISTFRFEPTHPVSMAPGCPTKIEFEFSTFTSSSAKTIISFNFANGVLSVGNAEAHLALRYC